MDNPLRKQGLSHHDVFDAWTQPQDKSFLCCCCSGAVVSDSLRPHGLQHTRPPCPSLSPRVCPSSCALSGWCPPTISSSAALFSFCLLFSPASGFFPMSWLFASGDQSIVTSASVLPMNTQGWFPLGLTGLTSLQSKDSQESSLAPQFLPYSITNWTAASLEKSWGFCCFIYPVAWSESFLTPIPVRPAAPQVEGTPWQKPLGVCLSKPEMEAGILLSICCVTDTGLST